MSEMTRRAFLAGLAGATSGCGFHPVYDRCSGMEASGVELAAIDVALIPERSGQLVRQELQQRFDHGQGVAKRYDLTVAFSLSTDAIGVQQDTTSTRLRMVGTANWTLKAKLGNTVLTSGLARALDGVNVVDQQYFAADLAGETATRRVAAAVSDQITLQLASYFGLAHQVS